MLPGKLLQVVGVEIMARSEPAPQQTARQIKIHNSKFWRRKSLLSTLASASCTRNVGCCPHGCLPQGWMMGDGSCYVKCQNLLQFTSLSIWSTPLDIASVCVDSIVPKQLIQTVLTSSVADLMVGQFLELIYVGRF